MFEANVSLNEPTEHGWLAGLEDRVSPEDILIHRNLNIKIIRALATANHASEHQNKRPNFDLAAINITPRSSNQLLSAE